MDLKSMWKQFIKNREYLSAYFAFCKPKKLYMIIVFDVVYKTILGHYMLDLDEKYGLLGIL